ncbi:hypothetical protein, partial [Dyella sp. ASV21]|uniref:hypothetical protein n=1 Tax=Dyella sp. ASV21 TaxID=2795114 RepID=UPI001E3AA088
TEALSNQRPGSGIKARPGRLHSGFTAPKRWSSRRTNQGAVWGGVIIPRIYRKKILKLPRHSIFLLYRFY